MAPEPFTLTRRSEPDRLRYMAAKLREDEANRELVAFALEVAAEELERRNPEPISADEFAAVVGQAFRDAGPIYDSTGPIATVLAAAGKLAR